MKNRYGLAPGDEVSFGNDLAPVRYYWRVSNVGPGMMVLAGPAPGFPVRILDLVMNRLYEVEAQDTDSVWEKLATQLPGSALGNMRGLGEPLIVGINWLAEKP